jgi:hypothetical protein
MGGKKKLLLLLSVLPLSLLAKANNGKDGKTEPVLHGYVSDATTKKPVSGVTISITTPKTHEKKAYVTDASGNFKVPQMLTGEVTIILEKKGYKTYKREGVTLKEGMTIRLNFDMIEVEDEEVFHPLLRMVEGGLR